MNWESNQLVGGHPILDFVNTVGDESKNRSIEWLPDWLAFRSWAACASVALLSLIDAVPRTERDVLLKSLIQYREEIYGCLVKISQSETHLSIPVHLMSRIQGAFRRSELTASGGRKGMRWEPSSDPGQRVIDTFSIYLEDLCRHGDIQKVKQCKRCTWLFINRGRGRGRQWCSMSTCGNRAKAQKFRENHP